ncbi:nucleotide pyrophosphatase [Microbacterium bovistercoris]|uniref:Nucleotide pyrophosphatase n=1 Tax=Microbacterium bovistercoris TaxID=2293570 RepID=A0A371NQF7_9MICO|nr:alkaline phosphatase family protein [Microbacterium bovistercoris]REJ04406.1 nucleotide pyrophosphatase [Microbacterium bovistercoris]
MPSFRRAACSGATLLLAAGIAVTAPSAAQAVDSDEPRSPRTLKTLVVGIDGASFDFLAPSGMPNLTGLREQGMTATSNLYASPMAPTVSGAGWSSIATGVWPDKHNVVDNSFAAPNYDEYPDYLTRLEAADPDTSTAVVGTWTPIPNTVFGPAVDVRMAGGNDEGTTAKAVELLRDGDPDDVFVHLDEVDGAGHSVGTNGAAYGAALRTADGQLGEMLDAIRQRDSYDDEEWLVVVTADHGHKPTGGHGGNTPAERKTFVIAAGPGIPAGSVRDDVKIVDIAPTILSANGVAVDEAARLDGRAFGDRIVDPFDALRPKLRTQVDETRPGAGTLGWTHETVDGWSIDNSRMPAGGVTEWRGWSFATDEFWTNAEPGQGRETSVRNRDVFAVADSDEWDDKAHAAGPFDSTLISPEYPLSGARTATLSYATNYAIDGPQTAEVLVSFDGAAPQSLKAYEAEVNTVEKLEIDVPVGARTAQFSFRYTGRNSAFWTVDQVQLLQESAPAAVTGLKATGGDGRITVSWAAPADGFDLAGYRVTATPVAAIGGAPVTVNVEGTRATIEGLTGRVPYRVTVVAKGYVADSAAVTTRPVRVGSGRH